MNYINKNEWETVFSSRLVFSLAVVFVLLLAGISAYALQPQFPAALGGINAFAQVAKSNAAAPAGLQKATVAPAIGASNANSSAVSKPVSPQTSLPGGISVKPTTPASPISPVKPNTGGITVPALPVKPVPQLPLNPVKPVSSISIAKPDGTLTPIAVKPQLVPVKPQNVAVKPVAATADNCTHVAPQIRFYPNATEVVAGAEFNFRVYVTNRDDPANCSASNFSLEFDAPTGWTVAPESASFSLEPNGVYTTRINVTSVSPPGDYGVSVTATNEEDESATATKNLGVVASYGSTASVAVDPNEVILYVADTQQFSATAYDSHGNEVPANFTWSTDLGTVNGSGFYNATAEGTGYVEAQADGTAISGRANVTVLPLPCDYFAPELSVLGPEGIDAGANGTLEVNVRNANVGECPDTNFTVNVAAPDFGVPATEQTVSLATGENATLEFSITAPCAVGEYNVTANATDGVRTSDLNTPIPVTAGALARVQIVPHEATLEPDEEQTYDVFGYDACNNSVSITANWSVDGEFVGAGTSLLFSSSTAADYWIQACGEESEGLKRALPGPVVYDPYPHLPLCAGYATLHIGDALGNDLVQVRLVDVGVAVGEDNQHPAMLDILNADGEVLEQVQLLPGEVYTGNYHGSEYRISVCAAAYGFTLESRWASVRVNPPRHATLGICDDAFAYVQGVDGVNLTITPTAANLGPGENQTFVAGLFDSYGNPVDFVAPYPAWAVEGDIGTVVPVNGNDTLYTVGGSGTNGNVTVTYGSLVARAAITIDRTGPDVAFVAPTPADEALVTPGSNVSINVTTGADASNVLLHWNGTDYIMVGSGTNYEYNITGLAAGIYTYNATAEDSYGNLGATETRVLHVSLGAPSIVLVSPPEGSHVINGDIATINISSADGIANYLIVVTCNGTVGEYHYEVPANPHEEIYNQTIYACPGGDDYNLTINATDVNGVWTSATFLFVSDQAPLVELVSPANGSAVLVGDTVALNITDNSVVDLATYQWDAGATIVFPVGNYNATVPELACGEHNLTVYAEDDQGFSTSATYTFTANTPPVVTLVSPANGSNVLAGDVIDLGIADCDAIEYVWYSWDEGAHYLLSDPYDVVVPTLSNGVHNLTVYAEDENDLNTTEVFSFNADERPQIQLLSPANGSAVLVGDTIVFNVTDNGVITLATYQWDTDTPTDFTVNYNVTVPSLAFGDHSLTVAATDDDGFTTTAAYVFEVDTEPVIELLSPANGSSVTPGETVIVLNVTDNNALNLVYYRWNGGSATLFDAEYNVSVPGTFAPGESINLTVYAEDNNGFVTTEEYSFNTNEAPVIALVSPAEGSYVLAGDTIVLDITDNSAVASANYSWDGGAETAFGVDYNVTVPALSYGSHNLTVNAQDDEGYTTTTTFNFVVDALPTITLVSPAAGSVVLAGDGIEYNVTDNGYIDDAYYNWDSGPWMLLTPRYNITVPGTLANGTHNLSIWVIDNAGYEAVSADSFVVGSMPAITLLSPANGSIIVAGDTVVFNITDNGAITSADYSWNGGAATPFATDYNVSVAGLAFGENNLTVSATDDEGFTVSQTYTFVFEEYPQIVLISPPESTTVNPGDVIVFNITDNGVLAHVVYKWNAGPWTHFTTEWNVTVFAGLLEGNNTLYVQAEDDAGLVTEANFTFRGHNTGPVIQLLSPPEGYVTETQTAVFNITDDVLVAGANYSVNGGPQTLFAVNYEVPFAAYSDETNITVFAEDNDGQVTSATFHFTVDLLAPNVSLVSPAEGSTVLAGDVIDFDVTDNYGLSNVTYNWDGAPDTVLASPYDVTVPTGLSSGVHNISVTATDVAGRVTSVTYNFTFDVGPPVITLLSPPEGYVTETQTAVFNITDDVLVAGANYSVNGGAQTPFGVNYEVPFAAYSDETNITVFAEDNDGQVTSATFHFTVDLLAPNVSLVSPAEGSTVLAGDVIDFDVTDNYGLSNVTYNWDGAPDTVLASPYDVTVPTGLPTGLHNITVTATDVVGRVTSATYNFTIDTSSPSIVLVSPANGSTMRAETPIEFNFTDDTGLDTATFTWNGGTPFTYALSGLSVSYNYTDRTNATAGVNTLVVAVNDTDGHVSTETFEFTLDYLAPGVAVVTDLGSPLPAGTLIDFNVTDDIAVDTVVVNATGPTPGNYVLASPYDLATTGWAVGSYTLQVTANDTVGRETTQTFSANITAPLGHGNLTGYVRDTSGVGIPGAYVEIVGTGLNTTTGPDGNFSFVDVDEGSYSVMANASGYAEQTITPVDVTAGSTTSITFYLAAYGWISGSVTEFLAPGTPIPGANVTIYFAGTTTVADTETTDGSGNYQANNLMPGLYDVTASASGHIDQTVTNAAVYPAAGTGVDFALQTP